MPTRMLFANNARATLTADLGAGVLSVSVGSGEGARFGTSPAVGEFLRATLRDAAGSKIELVNITAIAGDTMTIVRGQEGTVAQSFLTGDTISIRLTKESLTRLGQKDANESITGDWTVPAPAGVNSVTPKTYVDTLVAGLTAQSARGRNRFVNPAMRIDQRREGTARTFSQASGTGITSLIYLCDQWFWYVQATTSGAGTITAQRVYTNEPYLAVSRLTVTSAAVPFDLYFGQRVEHAAVVDMAGSNATIAFDLSLTSGSTIEWYVYRPTTNQAYRATAAASCFGTPAAPTKTIVASGTFTGITAAYSRKTATFAVPSGLSGGIGGLEVVLKVPAATAGVVWNIAGTAQIEKGSTATSFELKSFAEDLADCQAFYYKTQNSGVMPGSLSPGYLTARLVTNAVTINELQVALPVEMFTTPVVTWWNQSTGTADELRTSAATNVAVASTSNAGMRLIGQPTLAATPTANWAVYAHVTAEAVIP